MDIKEFSDGLKKLLEDQIGIIRDNTCNELEATAKYKEVVSDILFELKKFVLKYDFQDSKEEIVFFKEIKPYFLSSYLYYDSLFVVILEESFSDSEKRKDFYVSFLRQLKEHQIHHREFYCYYLSGKCHWDEKYFTRSCANKSLYFDDRFSTGYDIILSELLANEKLKNYLQNALSNLSQNHKQPTHLKWTGSKTALIELIYALQSVGVFNNGVADVKLIAKCFEELFDIRLGNYYDTYQQIRLRKINPTKFLELMKEKLLVRNDYLNGL